LVTDATVLLVHGAFHGAWCWSKVVDGLAAQGVAALAIDLPRFDPSCETSLGLKRDAEAVREILRECSGRVVLCGHSYGGAVITEAVTPEAPASHLVYLAALVPDIDEGLADCIPNLTEAAIFHAMTPGDGDSLLIDPTKAAEIFYNDCEPEDARWATSQLGPQAAGCLVEKATRAAWREAESTYILCENDLVLSEQVQERMAKRCTRVTRWPTGHSPMLSRPEMLIDLLAELAA
jgi:pimeloyl-ACP methyl ester carboxylesterase